MLSSAEAKRIIESHLHRLRPPDARDVPGSLIRAILQNLRSAEPGDPARPQGR